MEIELVKCECCGLKEDCTQDYITEVKSKFEGKWLCGLCAEAVTDEKIFDDQVDEALEAHISFCQKFKSNPAVRVADGLRQMLMRRSGNNLTSSPSTSSSSSKKYSRSSGLHTQLDLIDNLSGLFQSREDVVISINGVGAAIELLIEDGYVVILDYGKKGVRGEEKFSATDKNFSFLSIFVHFD